MDNNAGDRLKRAAIAAFAVLFAAVSGPARADAPRVVVTIKPVHALAAAVMAGVAVPALLVDGAASPHTFTLKPSAARAIMDANLLVRVSEATEPFTRRIAEALPPTVALLTLTDPGASLVLLPRREGGIFEQYAHDDDGAAPETQSRRIDGHVWLDPANAKAIADAIAAALAQLDAGNAATYERNAKGLRERLDELDRELAQQLAGARDRPIIVLHDAYQYFEKHFGLRAAGAITLDPDEQPSARRLSAVRAKIKSAGVACVLAEPGMPENLVAAVTEGTGATSVMLDPEGQKLEPGPELYFALMRGVAAGIASCSGR